MAGWSPAIPGRRSGSAYSIQENCRAKSWHTWPKARSEGAERNPVIPRPNKAGAGPKAPVNSGPEGVVPKVHTRPEDGKSSGPEGAVTASAEEFCR